MLSTLKQTQRQELSIGGKEGGVKRRATLPTLLTEKGKKAKEKGTHLT